MEINVGVFLLTCIWWLGTPRCVLLIGATGKHVLWQIPGINAGFAASWNRGGRGSRSTGEGYVPPRDLSGSSDVVSHVLNRIESLSNTNRNSCTRINLTEFNYQVSKDSFSIFNSRAGKIVDSANAISSLFLYSADSRRIYDNSIYFALAKGVIESDPMIYGCGFAFVPKRSNPQGKVYCPYVYRKSTSNIIVNTDLSSFNYMDESWYKNHKTKSLPSVNNAPGVSFSRTSDKNKTPRNSTIKMTIADGFWSQPYFECRDSKTSHWIITYSVPFYEQRGSSFKFRGVAFMDIDLSKVDINQCSDGVGLFANSHRCRLETTQCKHIPGAGLISGNYHCMCKPEFYFPDPFAEIKYFNGSDLEREYFKRLKNQSNEYDNTFLCLPCRKGCNECEDDSACVAEYDILMRGIPLGIQSFCMTITLVLGVIIVRLRKTKVMSASMWIMLEILLLGALLLYSTVVIQYFEPTQTACLLIPWLREVGFATVYGVLSLKIYRLLAEFQSRKAHRVHVRDRDLLKYLFGIVLVVLGYMSAWTAVNMDYMTDNTSLLGIGETPEKLKYSICKSNWWDYCIEIVEFVFLSFAIYLCYCVRSAPSDYGEGRYVSVAIYNEAVVSTVLYILRHFLWLSLHPDYMFLMYFIRCQLTVTIMLILVLGPKLWFAHRPPELDQIRSRAYSQSDVQDSTAPETMKLNVGISSNGDVDVGEINLADMDPEDIRVELKRLYTQLQIYKTKTMRKDNPHISKRRGGRKQTHRRFSLQPFHHKHRHHHDHDHEHEMSKTPEESTNSAEGVAIAMEGLSKSEDSHEGRSPPTVTFKPGHK